MQIHENLSSLGSNIFQFFGVYWNARKKTWQVSRFVDGVTYRNGTFEDEGEAAKASDELVRRNKFWSLPLNFPTDVTRKLPNQRIF